MKKTIRLTYNDLELYAHEVYEMKLHSISYENGTIPCFLIARDLFECTSSRPKKEETIALPIEKVKGLTIVIAELASMHYINELHGRSKGMSLESLIDKIWETERK